MKGRRGVTLIALIITIIVILIITGVTISTITGDNDTINNAFKAKENAQKKALIDNIQVDIIGEEQLTNASVNDAELVEIIKKYFDVPDGIDLTNKEQELTAKEEYGSVKMTLGEILVEE